MMTGTASFAPLGVERLAQILGLLLLLLLLSLLLLLLSLLFHINVGIHIRNI